MKSFIAFIVFIPFQDFINLSNNDLVSNQLFLSMIFKIVCSLFQHKNSDNGYGNPGRECSTLMFNERKQRDLEGKWQHYQEYHEFNNFQIFTDRQRSKGG